MCLGIPGRILTRWTAQDGAPMARADFAGQERDICLAYLPDLDVGDYTIVHMNFALTLVDEPTALATIELMREYVVFNGEPATGSNQSANAGEGSAA